MTDITRLYLIRHGEVEESYHQIFGGKIDMALSNLGMAHASSVASFMSTSPLDAVYVSPMKRAQQTAKPLLDSTELEAKTLDNLRELDFGTWTGLHWETVNEQFQIHARDWLDAMVEGRIQGAEPIPDACKRIESSLDQIFMENKGKRVALFCHGGVIRLMLSILLEVPVVKTANFEIDYGSISIVDIGAKYTNLNLLNLTPWRLQ